MLSMGVGHSILHLINLVKPEDITIGITDAGISPDSKLRECIPKLSLTRLRKSKAEWEPSQGALRAAEGHVIALISEADVIGEFASRENIPTGQIARFRDVFGGKARHADRPGKRKPLEILKCRLVLKDVSGTKVVSRGQGIVPPYNALITALAADWCAAPQRILIIDHTVAIAIPIWNGIQIQHVLGERVNQGRIEVERT